MIQSSIFKNSLEEKKFTIAQQMAFFSCLESAKFQTVISIHGVKVLWTLYSWQNYQNLCSAFPSSWVLDANSQFDVEVEWKSAKKLNLGFDPWDDGDPDCRFKEKDGVQYVVQRDFVACKRNNKVQLLCDDLLEDGFNNFLRWLLPRFFLKQKRLLLHSSAIVHKDATASLCLGVSGAGKTTISRMTDEEFILGDDMNLIERGECGKWYVTPALVGQAIQSSSLIGKKFLIHGFYILEKNQENKVIPVKKERAFTSLAGSVANLFWDQLSFEEVVESQELIGSVLNESDFYRLKFNLDGKVWTYVKPERP